MRSLVTLLTDFETHDGYVGAMKGVILARAPEAQLVDLTHEIPPQDVWAGARALRQAVPWFPPGTIHVAVVDPGVGTGQVALLLRSGGQLLIGPDNGLLSLAAGAGAEGWVLDRPELFIEPVSATFHGRDLFASVAGHLAAGRTAESCGRRAESWVRLEEPRPEVDEQEVRGTILHVDRFGNLVTNIRQKDLPSGETWVVGLGGGELGRIRRTFGEVSPGEWVAYWGSQGELELAVRDGSAAARLDAPLGIEVSLCRR